MALPVAYPVSITPTGEEVLALDNQIPRYLVTEEGPQFAQQDQPPTLTTITAGTRNPLTTRYLEHTFKLPQYPRTEPEGYTYCVNVANYNTGGDPVSEETFLTQYSKARKHPPKSTVVGLLGRVPALRYRYKCSGIKACHYMPRDLATTPHTKVDASFWSWMLTNRSQFDPTEPNELRQNAIGHARSIRSRIKAGLICRPMLDSCRIIWRRNHYDDLDGNFMYFATCVNKLSRPAEVHYYQSFFPNHQVDLPFLGELISQIYEEQEASASHCTIHESFSTRLQHCTALHSSSPGLPIKVGCEVEFNLIIPEAVSNTVPYILWTSTGTHTHLPPPPTKPPSELVRELKAVAQSHVDAISTRATFLRSGVLEQYLKAKGAESITDLHVAFANMSRISAIIAESKLSLFPYGPNWAGIQFEYNMEQGLPDGKRYIQGIWDEEVYGAMLICFTQQQALLLLEQKSFQIDMSFKRIRQKDMNEVTFAGLIRDNGEIVTFARAFVQGENAAMHKTLFERLFGLVSQRTGIAIKWWHIDGEGFRAVVMDMGAGQMKGLGQYLATLDPRNHSWEWHVKRVLICCRIHLRRTIEQVVGPAFSTPSAGSHMLSILDARSFESYLHILEIIRRNYRLDFDGIEGWCQHKAYDVIAAGLNGACSEMPAWVRASITNHTNAVESSHEQAYSLGKRMDLLPAVQSAKTIDRQNIEQYRNFQTYGIRESDRSKDIVKRFNRDRSRAVRSIERRNEAMQLRIRAAADSLAFENTHPSGRQAQTPRRDSSTPRSSGRSIGSGSRSRGSRTPSQGSSRASSSRPSEPRSSMGPPARPGATLNLESEEETEEERTERHAIEKEELRIRKEELQARKRQRRGERERDG